MARPTNQPRLDVGLLVVAGVALAGLVTTGVALVVTGWRLLYGFALPAFTGALATSVVGSIGDLRRARAWYSTRRRAGDR